MTDRNEYIAGLREFADWLEKNPAVETPYGERFLLALTTNPAVEAFATKHGLTVDTDDDGNTSADLHFGPIRYHAYGYADFTAYTAEWDEKRARRWVEKQGLELREAGESA